MTQLQVIKQNDELYIDSREVAEMIEKRHSDLVRSIEGYQVVLGQNAKLRSDDFFVESTYKAGTGKSYKHYLLTKKGCDMVANKMTGEKGILFTATYVDAFHEMEHVLKEHQLQIPTSPMEALRLMFQVQDETKQEVEEIKGQVIELKENVKLDAAEYGYIGKRVQERVTETIRKFSYANTQKVRSELLKNLNGDIKRIANVSTRSQLKQKDFEPVLDFINTWEPSSATQYQLRQIAANEVS